MHQLVADGYIYTLLWSCFGKVYGYTWIGDLPFRCVKLKKLTTLSFFIV
jgi:hypothetical protein